MSEFELPKELFGFMPDSQCQDNLDSVNEGIDDAIFTSDTSDTSDNGGNIINISDCLRKHSGNVRVKGTICSGSRLYKMVKSISYYCECKVGQTIIFPEPISDYESTVLYKKCRICNKNMHNKEYEYVNAVTIELQDSDSFS